MSTNYKIGIGKRIKKLRMLMNLSQEEFVSSFSPAIRKQSILSRIENGEVAPPIELFPTLADKGINIDWLFRGKGEMWVKESEESISIPPYAGRKLIKMYHQISSIIKEGDSEKIKVVEGILNSFSPRKGTLTAD